MKKSLFVILLLSLSVPTILYAADAKNYDGLVPCGPGGDPHKPYCSLCDFFIMIGNIFDFIIKIIVPSLATLMIAVGGFFYITAFFGEGGAGAVTKGGSVIKAAIIGLLIAYGSWLIVHTVFFVLGVNPEFLGQWNKIDCGSGGGTGY